jgi:hypothetical protein
LPVAPTASPAVDPTRLFAALTTPLTPVVPLPNVTAPTATVGLRCQLDELTKKLPLASAVTPSRPIKSKSFEPRSVLRSSPVLPLNKYTAPASRPPASSKGAVTTTLPVLSATTECPN